MTRPPAVLLQSSSVDASFDVFVSYAHADADAVRPIADALAAAGLRIWFDAVIDNDFASITRAIEDGLARSKALVAYYSRTYLTRRACQWELTVAFLAAQIAGDPRDRIFVINPEDDGDHLQPVELRDAIYRSASALEDANGRRELAAAVARRAHGIASNLGNLRPVVAPRWYGAAGRGSPRFVGRLKEMWAVHSGLHAQLAAITTARQGSGLAQVRGIGGLGKSLLAEEYALRFGAAFPGGIFWLRAFGHDDAGGGSRERAARDANRDSQLRDFLEELGSSVGHGDTTRVRGLLARAIERNGQPCLWVVDDLPSALDRAEQDLWLAPHPLARTLVTTRSHEYELGEAIDLSLLSERDAFDLLIARRAPDDMAEHAAARQLIADLGYHALATDVAGGALQALKGLYTFQSFRQALGQPSAAALRLAATLGPQLPNGHEKSIADTLLRSIKEVGDDAYDFLRMASLLGVAPIPPSLVALVFAEVFPEAPDDAMARAAVACDRAALLSLAQRSEEDEGGMTVHPLVARTVRVQQDPQGRVTLLRLATIRALTHIFLSEREQAPHAHHLSERLARLMPHVTSITRHLDMNDVDSREAVLLLNAAGNVMSGTGRLGAAEELTTRGLALAKKLGLPRRDLAVLRHHLGTVLFRRGLVSDAIDAYKEALRLVTDEDDHDDLVACILTDQSVALRADGRLEEAVVAARRALELDERRLGPTDRVVANDLNNLGMVLRTARAYAEARQCYERALPIVVDSGDESLHAKLHTNLARLLVDLHDLEGANRTYREALALIERIYGPDHIEAATTLNGLGMVARLHGDAKQAFGYLQRGLHILQQAPECDPRAEGHAFSEIGQVYRDQGHWDEALAWFVRALHLDQDVYGRNSLEVAEDFNNLGVTVQHVGHDSEARRFFAEAVRIRRHAESGRDVGYMIVLVNLSTSLWRLDEYEAALDALREAERTLDGLPDAPSSVVGRLAGNLTPVLRVLGRLTDARVSAERALSMHRASDADNLTIANDLLNLGRVLIDLGEATEGLDSITKALQTFEEALGSEDPQTRAVRMLLAKLSETRNGG